MKAVFLDTSTFSPDISFEQLSNEVDSLRLFNETSPDDIVSRCQDVDLIICNKTPLSAPVLAQLPNLSLICVTATGYNNIDIEAANHRGITVCNVSNYANEAVSQYVFAQLLSLFQKIEHHNQHVKDGAWPKSSQFCLHGETIHELAGKTMTIIGYGNLGQAVAHIARAFSMKVIIAERQNASTIRTGRIAFNDAISQADIISLHCPQTANNRGFINAEVFALCQPHCILINTARGALIDNQALLSALSNHQIGGAILDVLDEEPPQQNHPLLTCNLPNLTITGHIAWASIEAQQRLIALVANNIAAFKQGIKLNRVSHKA